MHPSTSNMVASASNDRTVVVWDSRRPQTASMVVNTGSPALALDWHPRKDYVFAVGLEDGSVATFDTRAPKHALNRLVRSNVSHGVSSCSSALTNTRSFPALC